MRLMTGAANGRSYEARAPVHPTQPAIDIKKASYVIAAMSAHCQSVRRPPLYPRHGS